jgi:Putative Actinobacterial Holin-X, holin superfamily III
VKSGNLAAEVIHDAQHLVGLEIALAKQELKDMAVVNAIAAGLVASGGLLLILGVLVAAPVLVVVLVPWHWEAAAVWVAAYLVIGITLALVGKARFQVRLPKRTLESLKESKQWALRRMRSNGR